MSTVTNGTDLNPTAASLLGFLEYGPMTGWDLDAWVRISIGNFWNVTRSQIYRELRDLTERGYAEAGPAGPRDRTPYTITPAGKEAFREWLGGDPGPDIIRSRLLLTVFFGDRLEPERLRQVLADHRRQHQAQLDGYRTIQQGLSGQRFVEATLRYGIAHEEHVVQWLEELEQELDQLGPGGA